MAAGLGFKTFTTSEVLTAGDVNGYLMQGINVFASSAARAAAITSPQEGQYSFLKDTNALEYYDGAAWVGAPVGDITAVTAGTGISGGGSSGAVTITNSMATEITASGDIIVGTGSGTFDNLPIGTTGQVLTADTTVSPYKVKWATASSGLSAATQAEMESASSTSVAVTPGRQQYHPSAAKGWANFNGTSTYTINASYNVSSVSSIGTAQYRVNWDVDFSSANYAFTMNCDKLATDGPTTATMIICNTFTVAAGYMDFALMCVNGTRSETSKIAVTAFGDQ